VNLEPSSILLNTWIWAKANTHIQAGKVRWLLRWDKPLHLAPPESHLIYFSINHVEFHEWMGKIKKKESWIFWRRSFEIYSVLPHKYREIIPVWGHVTTLHFHVLSDLLIISIWPWDAIFWDLRTLDLNSFK